MSRHAQKGKGRVVGGLSFVNFFFPPGSWSLGLLVRGRVGYHRIVGAGSASAFLGHPILEARVGLLPARNEVAVLELAPEFQSEQR